MAVEITNVRRLEAKLESLPELTRTTLIGLLNKSAREVERGAKIAAPVRTGRLRASIMHEIRAAGLEAIIGTNVKYAPFVEFGTRFNPAQPFLFPAFEDVRHRIARDWARALDRAYGRLAA